MIHEGDFNVYFVMVSTKRVWLHPLAPSPVAPKEVAKKTNRFLSSKEFEKEVELQGYGYALFVRHAATSNKIPSNERLEALMREYGDVFEEESPQGLLPLRGIEHSINLVPEAPLPNKPAYRCEPVASR